MSVLHAESLDLIDTVYSACSISTCPSDRSLFACGLYQIVKDETAEANEESPATKRLGRCLLNRMNDQGKIQELHRFEHDAILDMAWSHEAGANRLALADAAGKVAIYDYASEQLHHIKTVKVGKSGSLSLSLDWSNRLTHDAGQIVISSSDGSISILDAQQDFEVAQSWHAHEYEPWIAAWDYWNTQSVWTGGDDCKLKRWDLRMGTDMPAAVNKHFAAGVTTLQCHPQWENIFAVGSYDGVVRFFDPRNLRTPLSEQDVGGGVWRVRWHPSDPTKLLTACMHDGFKVLSVEEAATSSSTITRFDAHGKDALAYGVDWCQAIEGGKKDLIASCSFYDHQLRSWTS